jgi:mannosyltransferase OCH1-like enzyme
MDVECLKPMPKWLTDLPAFIDQERREQTRIVWNSEFSAMNSVMGSVPGHPFFKQMIDAMMSTKAKSVMQTTGPQLLTRVYKQFAQSSTQPNVKLLSHHVMSPLMDSQKMWKNRCGNS